MKDDRDLLFADICARLKYNVKVKYKCFHVHSVQGLTNKGLIVLRDETNKLITTDIKNIQPYLFPLSSMTEEQKEEWKSLMIKDSFGILYHTLQSYDYLYKNHIDIRGLIPMELGIDATGLNIY